MTTTRRTARGSANRAAGYIVAAALVIFVVVLARWLIPAVQSRGVRPIGDGKNLGSYRFDLTRTLVPRERIVPAGIPCDGIPALTRPRLYGAAEAVAAPLGEHGTFLVPSDLVIGVMRNGSPRCYPLRVMNWHEVVNDTLGGEPIVVTFNPPSFGVAAFDARVNGEALEFGVSGLVFQSNLLMYDRHGKRATDRARSSLWSQLMATSIAGPAAGRQLDLIPVELVSWGDWLARHPETTVLAGSDRRGRDYERDPYGAYFSSEELRFPVDPLPPRGEASAGAIPWKSMVLIAGEGPTTQAVSFATLAAVADSDASSAGHATSGDVSYLDIEGIEVPIRYHRDPLWALLEPGPTTSNLTTRYAFWFAWYAMRGANLDASGLNAP